jgi:acetoin utilization deacetylase AcuC-like enzyme
MLTIYSDDHARHHGVAELAEGQMRPAVEIPARAHTIIDRVREVGLGDIRPPADHGSGPLERVHTRPYLDFLENAWDAWSAEHGACDAFPILWVVRGMRQVEPSRIDGRIGFYAGDAGSPITSGTWHAARTAADVALTGLDAILASPRAAFALCRPPGHHASQDVFAGYCYLNNAAIAAQAARDRGVEKVAILDIDYHHGNGTQNIFYDRGDVLFVSIHADPADEYPYYLGYADERGAGAGEGQNLNLPLPAGTTFAAYRQTLAAARRRIADFGAELLVVSLGADTYKEDPISRFRLESDDFSSLGEMLAGAGLPTLFVMEGGYAVAALGQNVVNVLTGFESAQR